MLNFSPFAFEFTSPGPIAFGIGPLTIRWYGMLIASAVVIGTLLAQKLAKKRGIDPDMVANLALWLVVGAIPCARLYYVLFEWQRFQNQPWYKAFAIWEGGIAIHGNPSVPAEPASHGCIRIPMFAAEEFSKMTPIGTQVLVYDGSAQASQSVTPPH